MILLVEDWELQIYYIPGEPESLEYPGAELSFDILVAENLLTGEELSEEDFFDGVLSKEGVQDLVEDKIKDEYYDSIIDRLPV